MYVGRGRSDITVWEPGRVMMGWADPRNVARSTGPEPLVARAVAFHDRDADTRFVYVSVELAIVTDTLRDAVADRLATRIALPPDALMLAATHNHSGPGGFAGYLWYDLPSGGFSRAMLDGLADRIAEAAEAAWSSMQPAVLRWVAGETAIRRVATNRAWKAYNRNVGVEQVTAQTAERAVDPEMQLFRIDAVDGSPLAMINWLGVHGTCFHGDGTAVQADHKGLAAALFERELGPGFVAIFAQGSCGDVTANRRYDARRGVTVGPSDDDAESCAAVAGLEVEAARVLFERARDVQPEAGPLVVATRRQTLAHREISPRHLGGRSGQRTGAPTIALGMALGTDEGPGPLHPARRLQRALAAATRVRWRLATRLRGEQHGDVQIPLVVFGGGRLGRVFGVLPVVVPRLPDGVASALGETVRRVCNAEPESARFMPTEVDVQIARLGRWAIAGIAAEPTTVVGRRLRASLRTALASHGVHDVVVAGYTNGYSGYLVTPEEHLEQGYESGATIFGRWSLPLWQTLLDEVAGDLA